MTRKNSMFYIFIAALLWSTGGLLIKFINANPFTISGYRAVIALPVLLLLFPYKRLHFTKRVWIFALFPMSTGLLYVAANKLTTAANAIVLQFVSPVFIILFGILLFKDRIRKEDIFVVVASLFGIVLFFFDKLSPGNLLGNFLAILSGISCAAYYIAISRTKEDNGSIMIAAQIETIIITLPFMILYPVELTISSAVALLLIGAFQRGLSSALHARAAKHCSALDAILISMAEPLFNPLLVMIFIGEKPGRFALAGGLIVLCSVVLWNLKKSRYLKKVEM